MINNPAVMIQNYQTVITMTQNRTADQTLKAIHDDRTAQPYSVMNGLGALTSLYLTGAGASASGTAPQSLTPTTYATATLANYTTNINYLSSASAGSATFANGTATPLAGAVNFINNVVRANSSTEPPKRTFERYMVPGSTISPLDPRYANYNVATNPNGLTTADTASFVVPSYLSSFTVPAPYATTTQWVEGFTVTQAMVTANGGNPITAPNLGTFDASGNFIAATFGVGAYVPGIGTSPRPYRVSTAVNVPGPLYQVINSTDPYADGAFPSGHTNSATTQALGVAFLVPQQAQELLTRAADLGNDRILAGMHSPLDVMGGRMEGLAIAATNIYAALYDANGNRLDWTNAANTAAFAVYQAYNQTQSYLASACGAVSVNACLASAQASGANAGDPYGNAAANKAAYTAELTYGFQPIGPVTPLTDAQVPVQAQVLLLTRFPYLSDAQRTDVLATTGLPSGYPLLSGDTYGGWGQLNLYAAFDGYGAFNSQVAITMDARLGGYSAVDSFNNDISGTGGLTKAGTGVLTLSGTDTYTGPTLVNGGSLIVTGSSVSPTTVNSGGLLGGTGQVGAVTVNSGGVLSPGTSATLGALTINGTLSMATGSTLAVNGAAGTLGASLVKVTGAATLTGGTVLLGISDTSASYRLAQSYKILQAGTLTGTFTNGATFALVPTTTDLYYRLRYDLVANAVVLDVRKPVDFTTMLGTGATRNQLAVATALNGGVLTGSDSWATTLNALSALSPDQRRTAFDTISGQSIADISTGVALIGNRFADLLGQRLAVGGDTGGDASLVAALAGGRRGLDQVRANGAVAQGASAFADGSSDSHAGAWVQTFGGTGRLDGTVGTATLTDQSYGVAAGIDAKVAGLTIGGAFAASALDTRVEGLGSTNRGTLYQGGGYAAYDDGTAYVSAIGSYFSGDVDSSRQVYIGSAYQGNAKGTARVTGYTAGGTVGYRIALGGGTRFTPQASIQATHVDRNAFTETGAGGLSLAVAKDSRDIYTTTVEGRISHVSAAPGGIIEPYAGAGVAFTGGDLGTIAVNQFTGAPTGTGLFSVAGTRLAPTTALINGGIEAHPTDRVTLGMGAETRLSNRQREGRLDLHVRLGF